MATEYISREAAIAAVQPTNAPAINHVLAEMLNKVPAADVRPVVRCKDCRFFYNGFDEKCCINHKGVVKTDENGFCHHAERRADNG